MELKLGDEFWDNWSRDDASTDPLEHRVKYKVVEIVRVHQGGNYGPMIDAPRLQPLEVESRNPTEIIYSLGHEEK